MTSLAGIHRETRQGKNRAKLQIRFRYYLKGKHPKDSPKNLVYFVHLRSAATFEFGNEEQWRQIGRIRDAWMQKLFNGQFTGTLNGDVLTGNVYERFRVHGQLADFVGRRTGVVDRTLNAVELDGEGWGPPLTVREETLARHEPVEAKRYFGGRKVFVPAADRTLLAVKYDPDAIISLGSSSDEANDAEFCEVVGYRHGADGPSRMANPCLAQGGSSGTVPPLPGSQQSVSSPVGIVSMAAGVYGVLGKGLCTPKSRVQVPAAPTASGHGRSGYPGVASPTSPPAFTGVSGGCHGTGGPAVAAPPAAATVGASASGLRRAGPSPASAGHGAGEGGTMRDVGWLREVLFSDNDNLFIGAPAGYGKTALLRHVIIPVLQQRYSKGSALWVTATTGVAARAIGGQTIHSVAGVGRFAGSYLDLLQGMTEKAKRRWKSVQCIIVEECSMMSGSQLEKLEAIARFVKKKCKGFWWCADHNDRGLLTAAAN